MSGFLDSDFVPFSFFLAFVAGAFGLQFWFWRRRIATFRALAETYGLQRLDFIGDVDSCPDPMIQGWVLGASYPRYLAGKVDGIGVVAFDYRIGWGKGVKEGSGVGVKRDVFEMGRWQKSLGRGMVVKEWDGWTFAYQDPFRMMRVGRLPKDEIVSLWERLLRAPGLEHAVAAGPEASRPGEVHLRPVRRGE